MPFLIFILNIFISYVTNTEGGVFGVDIDHVRHCFEVLLSRSLYIYIYIYILEKYPSCGRKP